MGLVIAKSLLIYTLPLLHGELVKIWPAYCGCENLICFILFFVSSFSFDQKMDFFIHVEKDSDRSNMLNLIVIFFFSFFFSSFWSRIVENVDGGPLNL